MTDEVLQGILDDVMAAVPEPRRPAAERADVRTPSGPVIGTLAGFRDGLRIPLVVYPGQPMPAAVAARTAVPLSVDLLDSEVVLLFEGGDPSRPIVMGCLPRAARPSRAQGGNVEIRADGQRLVVTAEQQLVLRCGKASITLSQDGRIVVKGASVVTHAEGVNRIRGGSVQIN